MLKDSPKKLKRSTATLGEPPETLNAPTVTLEDSSHRLKASL